MTSKEKFKQNRKQFAATVKEKNSGPKKSLYPDLNELNSKMPKGFLNWQKKKNK